MISHSEGSIFNKWNFSCTNNEKKMLRMKQNSLSGFKIQLQTKLRIKRALVIPTLLKKKCLTFHLQIYLFKNHIYPSLFIKTIFLWPISASSNSDRYILQNCKWLHFVVYIFLYSSYINKVASLVYLALKWYLINHTLFLYTDMLLLIWAPACCWCKSTL